MNVVLWSDGRDFVLSQAVYDIDISERNSSVIVTCKHLCMFLISKCHFMNFQLDLKWTIWSAFIFRLYKIVLLIELNHKW